MKFFDHATITVESGKGGNGCASARREAGVPYGGPNGGNGGRGGHIMIQIDPQLNTLMPFKHQRVYKASYGEPGQSRDKYGKNAEDLIIYVPIGTVIKDRNSGHVVYVANEIESEDYLLLKGGDGGAGNMHFKNSIVQYPEFCLLGEPGQYMELELELQLLADVGLIGTPSVGKSSIINMVSNAKATVAEYHFTTITPNLGSVSVDGVDRNVIDIPGLIEGASEGKGLGIEFLRHILKCSVFDFVIDLSRRDDGILEFGVVWKEILTYCVDRFAHEYDLNADDIKFQLTHDKGALILSIGYGLIEDDQGIMQLDTIITRKVLIRTINKSDASTDLDINQEYMNQFVAYVQTIINDQEIICEIDSSTLESLIIKNTTRTSTYLHEGIDKIKYLWKNLITEYNHIADIARHTYTVIDPTKRNSVTLLDAKAAQDIDGYLYAKPYLEESREDANGYEAPINDNNIHEDENILTFDEELGYNDDPIDLDVALADDEENDTYPEFEEEEETNDSSINHGSHTVINIRSIYEPDIARIVYMIPRGNDQAEQWFWKYMQKSGAVTWLKKHKVKHGDILTFEHPYCDGDDKKIIFEA